MFKNEFSWSKSRNDIFRDCQRKYYYHYYGSWNGWDYRGEDRARLLYRLKKLQSRYMWLGSAVHLTIENLLKAYRMGQEVGSFEEIKEKLLNSMRQDFLRSRENIPSRKYWRLYEHEYQRDVSKEEWKASADQAVLCFENFWNSEIHEEIKKLEADQWLEVEEFSSFYIEDVKVHVVLDFSYRRGDEVFIYDWKTGKSAEHMNELQLACYRIYAQEKWQVPLEKIHALEFNLFHNKVVDHLGDGLDPKEALGKMQASIDQMKGLLVDISENTAEENDFAFTEDEGKCDFCVFQKACSRF